MAKKKNSTRKTKPKKSSGMHLRDTSVGARRNRAGVLEVQTRCGQWVDRGEAVRAAVDGADVCDGCGDAGD